MVRPQASGDAEDVTLRTRRIGVVSGRKMVRTATTKPMRADARPAAPPRSTLETLLTKGPVALLLAAGAAFVLAAAVFLFKASRNGSEPAMDPRMAPKVEQIRPEPTRQMQQPEPVERAPTRVVEPADPSQPAPQPPAAGKPTAQPPPAAPKSGPGPSTGPDPGAPANKSGTPARPKSQTQTQSLGDPGAPDLDPLRDPGDPQPQEGGAPRPPRKQSDRQGPVVSKESPSARRDKKELQRAPQ